MRNLLRAIPTAVLLCLFLTACQNVGKNGPPLFPRSVDHIPNAVPKHEPITKRGNPPHYTVMGQQYRTLKSRNGYKEKGHASWYGTKFHGRLTSSGEPYDLYGMTAAHKTLPLPTYAKVTNLLNGKHVIVKINDRGPFHSDRIIDLSYAAARKLGIYGHGTGLVEVEALEPGGPTKIAHSSASPKEVLYLQLGVFSQHENAKKLANQLQSYGNVVIEQSDMRFRVRIGPFHTAHEASILKAKLSQTLKTPPILVSETP